MLNKLIYGLAIILLTLSQAYAAKRVAYIVGSDGTLGRDTTMINFLEDKMGYTVTTLPQTQVSIQAPSYWTTNFDGVILSQRLNGTTTSASLTVANLFSVDIPKLILNPNLADEFQMATIVVTNSGTANTITGGLRDVRLWKVSSHLVTEHMSDSLVFTNNRDENTLQWWSWGGLAAGVTRLFAIYYGAGYNPFVVKINGLWRDTVWAGVIDEGGVLTGGGTSICKVAFNSTLAPLLNPIDDETRVGWCHEWELMKNLLAWLMNDWSNPYVNSYHCFCTDFDEVEYGWTEIGGPDYAATYANMRIGIDSDPPSGKILSFWKVNDLARKVPTGQKADSLVMTWYAIGAHLNSGVYTNPVDFAGFNFREDWYRITGATKWTAPASGKSQGIPGTPTRTWVNRHNRYNDGTTVVPWSATNLVEGVDMEATPFDTTSFNSVDPVDPFVLNDSIKVVVPSRIVQEWMDSTRNNGVVGKPTSYVSSYSPNDIELSSRNPFSFTSPTITRWELFTSPYGVPIDQAWRDTSEGLLTLDTLYTMTEDISSSKWGLIFASNDIKLNTNNFTFTWDDRDSTVVYNHSFEIPDTVLGVPDTTKAAGWDFTSATSTAREWGHFLLLAENDMSSVYDQNYALNFNTPCSDQFVLSEQAYTFAANTHWCVSAQAYNSISGGGNIRFKMFAVEQDGDTAYSATCAEGTFARGFMPIWVDFVTDTAASYKIGIQVYGASAAPTGEVYIDDIRIQTYKYHGMIFGCDTLRTDADYMLGTYDRYLPGKSYGFQSLLGSNCKVFGHGRFVQGDGQSFASKGVYGNYSCRGDTVRDISLSNNGIASVNVFSNNAEVWGVESCSLFNYSRYGLKRDQLTVANVKLEGGALNGGYGSIIDSNYMTGSCHVGVSVNTRVDNVIDGIDTYPLIKVWNNVIQHQCKYANGFGIISYNYAGADIRNNVIDSDTGRFCGRGIQLAGLDTLAEQHAVLLNNRVKVQQLDNFQEYGYGREPYACQIEGTKGLVQRGNYWKGKSQDYIYSRFGSKKMGSAALRASASPWNDEGYNIDWTCVGDTFVAQATGRDAAVALSLLGLDSARYRFDSCVVISNDIFVQMGEVSGSNFLRNTKFVVDTSTFGDYSLNKTSGTFTPFLADGNFPYNRLNIVDPSFGDNALRDSLKNTHLFRSSFYDMYNTAGTHGRYRYGWTHTLEVDSGALAVVGANTYIIDVHGDTLVSGVTDAQGRLISYIYEFTDSAQASPYSLGRDRVNHNDYTIALNWNSLELDSVITMNQKRTTLMNFVDFVSTLTRTIVKRVNLFGVAVRR